MEPTDVDDKPEGDSPEEENEEESEEENRSSSGDNDDVEENEGGNHVEGFLSALSKETLKPRNKVRSYTSHVYFTPDEV